MNWKSVHLPLNKDLNRKLARLCSLIFSVQTQARCGSYYLNLSKKAKSIFSKMLNHSLDLSVLIHRSIQTWKPAN